MEDSRVITFGCNDDGQLGRNDQSSNTPFSVEDRMTESNLPQIVRDLTCPVAAVSCGSRHTIALTQDGRVFTWGWGKMGQLGHGNDQPISTPTCVEYFQKSNIKIAYVSAGGCHSGAVAENGSVYMWGESHWGQLGIPLEQTETHQTLPLRCKVQMAEKDERIVQLSCGGTHTIALSNKGRLYAWGRGDSGQLGIGKAWIEMGSISVPIPQPVMGFDNERVVKVACGAFHSAAVTESGKLYTWGKEDYGMLGLGPTPDVQFPKKVPFFDSIPVRQVSCGGWHTVAVTEAGETFAFGRNEYGRLGLGDTRCRTRPKKVMALDGIKIKQASCGGSHTLFLSQDGEIFSAGRKGHARLGSATNTTSLAAELVDEFSKFKRQAVQISAGGAHSACLC